MNPTLQDVLNAVQANGTAIAAVQKQAAADAATLASLQAAVAAVQSRSTALEADLDAFEARLAGHVRVLTAIGLNVQTKQAHP